MTFVKAGKKQIVHTRKVLTAISAARMQQAMTNEPQSLDELVVISGLAKPVVTRYVRELHEAEQKMIHIADWGKDVRGYATIRKFGWGNKPDKSKPLKWASAAERMFAKRNPTELAGTK